MDWPCSEDCGWSIGGLWQRSPEMPPVSTIPVNGFSGDAHRIRLLCIRKLLIPNSVEVEVTAVGWIGFTDSAAFERIL